MDFYRSLFSTLNNCETIQCKCVDNLVNFNYKYFFLDQKNFNDLKRLHYPVKNHYKPRTVEQVNNDSLNSFHFDTTNVALNEFCLIYDWANSISYFYYNETRECLAKYVYSNLSESLLIECGSVDSQIDEEILKCFFEKIDCNNDVKTYIAIGELMDFQEIIKGDLYDFVVGIVGNNGHQTTFHNWNLMIYLLLNIYILKVFLFQ